LKNFFNKITAKITDLKIILWLLIFVSVILAGALIYALISFNNPTGIADGTNSPATADPADDFSGVSETDGSSENALDETDGSSDDALAETGASPNGALPETDGAQNPAVPENPDGDLNPADANVPETAEDPESAEAVDNRSFPAVVRGIYVTANRAGLPEYFEPLLEICAETEVNAMVIDVKNDLGEITFGNVFPEYDELGITKRYIPDIHSLIEALNERDIYPIARIVAFKDDSLTEARPDLYIKDADGEIWRDSSRAESAWLNPYNTDTWDYLLEIAKGAIDIGFREIQFDYIRFDTSGRLADADFGDTEGKSRIEIITEFTAYASEKIKGWGAFVSADVYGTIISIQTDAEIVGQDYKAMAAHLDYICPMIYPSHYADFSFGIEHPDTMPYEMISEALALSNKALSDVEDAAVVRPWLQGFTASYLANYIDYTPEEIKAQIKAVYDAGLTEWIIWNSSSNYIQDSFEPKL